MKKYINKRIYTDVESYLVTEIDEVKGTAMAVAVEKQIKPKMIPGGFAAHCPDLNREFAEAEPVIRKGAKAFPIKRNKDGSMKSKTSHTLNPVPFIIYDNVAKDAYTVKADNGQFGLSNVAATVVNFLGFDAPEMWDESVIELK